MYDVLIAGAGPAGAIAATILARAGARVLVLDRARFPRPKLCGDTLNPGALAILARLGLDCTVGGALPLAGMIVTGGDEVRVEGRYGDVCGQAIGRGVFDAALVNAAAGAGARVEQNVLVQEPIVDSSGDTVRVTGLVVRRSDGRSQRITAPIVIAADGRYSRVARALRLSRSTPHPRRWAIGAYFENVGGMTRFGEMHVRANHYIGVAPLPGSLTNACMVTPAPGGQPAALLSATLSADCQLRARFAQARMVSPATCLGPLGVDCDVAGVPGLLLAGDAAGFVDPMTGDGLRFAMRGAELAAHEALHALEHGTASAHQRLLAARRREFAAKWRFNHTMRWLVSYPGTVRAARYGAIVLPQLLQRAIRYAGDVHAA
jgi:geranylgeranyl reductase family protein